MSDPNDQLDLPPAFADALRAAYTHRPAIPASVDAAISHAARDRFDRRRRSRMQIRWGAGLAAGLAAVIVLAVSLHHPAPSKPLAKGDVNADGQLNIVDALALARHLAAKDKIDQAWDLNGDGVIDQRDVDAIAVAAVNLKQTGLATRSLPKFDALGLYRPVGSALVGSASADGISRPRATTFAKANPTNPEAHQ